MNKKIISKNNKSKQIKTGYWIAVRPLGDNFPIGYMCSECENGDWDIKPTDEYCKFCGAYMKGTEDVE